MVARTRKTAGLRVTFHCDGQEMESETASTGERALKIGLLLLARLDDLQHGDRLTVENFRGQQ
jgi:hypothetical protein